MGYYNSIDIGNETNKRLRKIEEQLCCVNGNLLGDVVVTAEFNTSYDAGNTDATTVRTVEASDSILNLNISDMDTVLNAGNSFVGVPMSMAWEVKTVTGSTAVDADVIAAVASNYLKVLSFSIINTTATAVTVTFKSDGTGGTALWTEYLPATVGARVSQSISFPASLFNTAIGKKLTMDVDSGATLIYNISYIESYATVG